MSAWALTSAVSTLDEARWLRQPETEADALLLLALVHGTRGSTSTALTFAAEAVDRWPARTPGIGEAVATLARLELGIGAASEARAHLIEYAPEMPTPIDSLHIRLALAEIELLLGHRAIAIDVVRELDHTESPPCVAHRVLALRLEFSEVDIDDALDQFSALLRHGRIYDIAVLGPSLIAALRKSNRSHAEAADCTLTSIQRSGDLRAALRWHAAVGRSPETHETLVELVRRATEENLWPSLMQLGLEHRDELLAWRALKRILPHLSRADQNALTLEPWAVAASRLDTEVH